MHVLRTTAGYIRGRARQRGLPRVVTLTDFNPDGVTFEISNATEYVRVLKHGYETEYTAAMLAELRPDDVLYDIGANVGMVSLHAAHICTTVAFEPDPEFADRLAANQSLNPTVPIAVHRIAVGDVNGEATLYTDGASGNSPSLVSQRGERFAVTVPCRSLDSLWADSDFPVPTVIKMDVEGAEILVLRGARQFLTSDDRPRSLLIEIHTSFLEGFGSSEREVHSHLQELGYTREVYRAKRDDQTHLIVQHQES